MILDTHTLSCTINDIEAFKIQALARRYLESRRYVTLIKETGSA